MQFGKKRLHLGYFATKEEAAAAYDKKAIELFGDFARVNNSDNVLRFEAGENPVWG